MSKTENNSIEVIQGDDVTCCSYILYNEDHTLGNALRYVINKNPQVELCAYGQPHPAEKKITLRIQTRGVPATEVLREGLENLRKISEEVLNKFQKSLTDYKSSN